MLVLMFVMGRKWIRDYQYSQTNVQKFQQTSRAQTDSTRFRKPRLRNQRLISYLRNLQHPKWWGLRLLQPCWWRLSFRIWSRVDFGRFLDISEYGVKKMDAMFLAHYLDCHEALGKMPFRTVTGVLSYTALSADSYLLQLLFCAVLQFDVGMILAGASGGPVRWGTALKSGR